MDKEPILTRNFSLCFIAQFCCSLIFYLLISIAAEYGKTFGTDGALSGLVSGIFVIGILITRFFFSRILIRTGWKKMLYLSQIIHLISVFLYFFINSLGMLIAVRLIHGLCYGLVSSVSLTTGTYQVPKSRYGEGNGYFMTSITLSLAIGPYLGGAILDRFGPYGCFIAAAIASIILFASLVTVDLPKLEAQTDTAPKAKGLNSMIEVSAIPITLCILVAAIGYSSVLSFFRLYGKAISMERTVSVFFLMYSIVLLLTRPIAGKIQDKYGDNVVIIPCILMQVVSHILLALCPTTVGIILSSVLCAAGYGTLASVISSIASREVSSDRKSYAVATYWIGCDLANGVGPIILGAVSDFGGFSAMYLGAAVFALLAIPLFFLYKQLRHAH